MKTKREEAGVESDLGAGAAALACHLSAEAFDQAVPEADRGSVVGLNCDDADCYVATNEFELYRGGGASGVGELSPGEKKP